MEEPPEHWRNLIEAAHLTVQRAQQGDANAAESVLAEAIIGLRTILELKEPADPHRLVSLAALLKSLERIQSGEDPAAALHLKQGHRRQDPTIGVRDVLLWVSVGKELDKLTMGRGHTRQDRPAAAALKLVAKEFRCSVATVQKAWSRFGAAAGWDAKRDDWK